MKLGFDFQYAWRLLLKSPLHSLLCAVVVALSVGLTLWVYIMDYNMVLKPLPFPGSQQWISVQIAPNAAANAQPRIDAYTYQKMLEQNYSARYIGAFASLQVVVSEGQTSNRLRAAAISPELLQALQVAPLMGRLFDTADGQPDAAPAVLLGFSTWQNYFAGDPAVLGRTTQIDGRPVRIAGVMPQDFYAFQDYELWLPLQLDLLASPGDSTLLLSPLVELQDGQTAQTAQQEMQAAVAEVNRNYPQLFDAGRRVELVPAHRMWSNSRVPILAMASFTAVAVLLLGCLNISLIFFARLIERSRELALRSALGSTRGQLMRQCLLESLPVVLLGLALGIGLAALGVEWVQSLRDFPEQVLATGRAPDYPTLRPVDLLAAGVVAAVIWLLSTLIPAWRIARQDPAEVLAGSGKGTTGHGGARAAGILVGFQVLASSLLLVICANIVAAVQNELSKPSGLNTASVMVSTYPTAFDSRYADANSRLNYWEELQATIGSRIPDAQVAYSTAVPTRPANVPVAIEGQEGAANQGTLTLPLNVVSDGYFGLLGIELRSGRLFDSTDNSTAMNVAVVDENTAQRYWPQLDAVGKRIQLDPGENGPWLTIVGVVSGVAGAPYSRNIGGIYRPLRQAAPDAFHVLARLPPAAAANARVALREAAFAVDQQLPLHNLQLVDDVLNAMNGWKALAQAFSAVALVTLALAAIGLTGLIARSVAQRTQEVGIRRALGSTSWQITALFMRKGALYLSVGIVGSALGILLTTVLARRIPNILASTVPVTLGVLLLLAVVILLASSLPTRRALALEPGDALRYE